MPEIIPWYYKAAAGALLTTVLLGGTYAGFEHWKHNLQETADKAGYDRSEAKWKLKEQGIKDAAENEMAQGIAKARAETATIQEKYDTLSVTRLKENQNAAKILAVHDAAAAARVERLSIATTGSCGTVPGASAAGDSGAAAGTEGEARADLLPGTARAIFHIASDSAGLVRDYNKVIDLYETVRTTCNNSLPPPGKP
jgi:hypothetical protein